MVQNFEELHVWQKAHKLALMIYKTTKNFPDEEKFGITNQLRRAVISIGNNIAEGFGRRTTKDFINFLHNSFGSLFEVRSMIRISKDLNYLDEKQFNDSINLTNDIHKMLNKFISSLKKANTPII